MHNVLIVGASRGIGLGLTRACLERGDKVYAVARNPNGEALAELHKQHPQRLVLIAGDLTATDVAGHIEAALQGEQLDILLFNAGIMGPQHQDVAQASADEVATLFLTNAIAPMRLARQLAKQVRSGGVIAFMSSQMGSVALARSAEMPLYGASKAALNSLLQSWDRSTERPQACLLALHPGWVRTEMGGDQATLDVATSVAGLLATVEAHLDSTGCHFLDYQQQTLAW
ncbi:SDR family oxidoreductase [Pseudomonas sp. Gutcm_11s]|uniref:SDR family oxidoreductase n=1 Tax=Pseudomonas sp. Gutcm_11s TaxID=3026088 RepID=UPI00235DF265|nr:SDR family oxidoreductase [Pseudomonas sp. Gutcm_11s]MDD0841957.1 SDR family oxidoreductase [Pseudomonas sp. Gutcm_11s]